MVAAAGALPYGNVRRFHPVSPARRNCCAKASLRPDLQRRHGILLTVRGAMALCSCRDVKDFAMIETVTAFLGLFSAGIFIAHAFEGFRSRA
jgi:hypothetical protein